MKSEAARVAEINRRAERDKLTLELGREVLTACKELAVAVVSSDAAMLLLGWWGVEEMQKRGIVGSIGAASLETSLAAGFALNGFNKLVK